MTREVLQEIESFYSAFLSKMQIVKPFDAPIGARLAEVLSGELESTQQGLAIKKRQTGRSLILESGFAGVVQCFRDGRQQIVRLLVPGDQIPVDYADGVLEALTDCTTREIDSALLRQLCTQHSQIGTAFESNRILGEARFIRWVAFLGAASAEARIAYFIAECHMRLSEVRLARDFIFGLPITQKMIAQIVGLSLVHTNKSLKQLTARRVIQIKGCRVQILDHEMLLDLAGYDPAHCGR